MQIHYDEDEYETVVEARTCPFHQNNPGGSYAGCTCSMSVGSRRRPQAEIDKIKAERRRADEDRILAEAELIKARRLAI